jgi:DNA-binding beta-propeller fold protein YncE
MMSYNNRLIALCLSAVLLISCSSQLTTSESLSFPGDANQPFLKLEHVVSGSEYNRKGLRTRLFGAEGVGNSLLRPVALAEDAEGKIYIVDADAAEVFIYELEGSSYSLTTSFGKKELVAPSGIAIWNDEILVADGGLGRICRYNESLEFIDTLDVENLERPGQLKVNPLTNDLFIVDTPNHYVVSINSTGQITGHLQHKQTGDQLLGSPMAVDFTADGNIVVLDGLSRRVEIFGSDYKYQRGFGVYDRVPGSFSSPKGLAIASDGVVFISDAAFGNIQIFDLSGALLYFFGEIGKEAGEFLLPGSLLLNGDDKLFVMDQFNSRIQIFQYMAQED